MDKVMDMQPDENHNKEKTTCTGCWSVVAAPDKTQICPTEAFFVSTQLLDKLKRDHGPGTRMKSHWLRYGWELTRQIIGRARLLASQNQRGVGIGKLLSSMIPNTNGLQNTIITAVVHHVQDMFSVGSTGSDPLKVRQKLLAYGWIKARYGMFKLPPKTLPKVIVRKKEHLSKCGAPGRIHKKAIFKPSPSPKKTVKSRRKRVPKPSSAVLQSNPEEEYSIENYMEAVIANNGSVSSEGLRNMLNDQELQAEVDTIMGYHKQTKRPSATRYAANSAFVEVKQEGSKDIFNIPVTALVQWSQPCTSMNKNHSVEGCQVCAQCKWHCSDSSAFPFHCARRHYVPSLCTNSLRESEIVVPVGGVTKLGEKISDEESAASDATSLWEEGSDGEQSSSSNGGQPETPRGSWSDEESRGSFEDCY